MVLDGLEVVSWEQERLQRGSREHSRWVLLKNKSLELEKYKIFLKLENNLMGIMFIYE